MELGTQIKQYRKELGISQDELAERIFVSRQSISNWENNKTYPDIHTLLLLSDVFSVSLDELIKGDVEEMKHEIVEQERVGFQLDAFYHRHGCDRAHGGTTFRSRGYLGNHHLGVYFQPLHLLLRTRGALQKNVRHPNLQRNTCL